MAVTKIKPVKSALKQRLEYVQNPAKTDGKMLVSSFGCSYETADIEFENTLSRALEKGNNLAHHLIQSFEPGESTPEQAHEIGRRLADEITKGRHEYVLTTHIDKGHIHNHLIFCAASFIDYKKYVSNKKSYYEIRNASDRLCKEYSLSVVTPGQDKGKGDKERVVAITEMTAAHIQEYIRVYHPNLHDKQALLFYTKIKGRFGKMSEGMSSDLLSSTL